MWIRCFPLWRENAKPWHRTYVYLCKSAADIPSKLFLYKYEITFPMFWPGFHKWHFVRGQEKTAVCIFVWWEGVQKVFGKSKKSQRCSVIHQQTHSVLNVIFFPQISFFFSMRIPDRPFVCQIYRLGAPRKWPQTEKQHIMRWTKGTWHPKGSWKDALSNLQHRKNIIIS